LLISAFNNRFQPTVKSVIFFAKAKKTPLFKAAEAGVRVCALPESGAISENDKI